MLRLARSSALALLLVAGLVLAGCGNKEEERLEAETEGIYLTVGGLLYQVQISRYINAADEQDDPFLFGLPEGIALDDDETWFGVFIRVINKSDEEHPMATRFVIEDTQDNLFRPIPLDPKSNPYVYEPRTLEPDAAVPRPNSAAYQIFPAGALLLFRLEYQATQNRPLELQIHSPDDPNEVGTVNLDL